MGSAAALWECFRLLPLLFVAMLAVRGLCILVFNPVFRLAGTGTNPRALPHPNILYFFTPYHFSLSKDPEKCGFAIAHTCFRSKTLTRQQRL